MALKSFKANNNSGIPRELTPREAAEYGLRNKSFTWAMIFMSLVIIALALPTTWIADSKTIKECAFPFITLLLGFAIGKPR
jgi:hypothetical protein